MAEYIERETLLAHIKDLPTWRADAGGYYGGAQKLPDGLFEPEDIIASIENAPAADVAPVVHGRWEWASEDIYRCTACNEKARVAEVMGRPAWGHCPHCGAKMRGGTGGNDANDHD